MLAWKGSVLMRQRMERLAREAGNPQEQKLWDQLETVAAQLATSSLATPSDPQQRDAWRENLVKLTREKEELEAQFSRTSADFRRLRSQSALTPDELAKCLPPDTAVIDLLQFNRRVDEKQSGGRIKTHWEHRLAAFVLRSADHASVAGAATKGRNAGTASGTQPEQSVAMIDLGLIGPIDAAVGHWREVHCGQVAGKGADDQPSAFLRRMVWEPLLPHLENVHTVLISPDGTLNQIPWSALPGSKAKSYLLEDYAIATLPVPQMLPELESAAPLNSAAAPLLLVGDVDFSATGRQVRWFDAGSDWASHSVWNAESVAEFGRHVPRNLGSPRLV